MRPEDITDLAVSGVVIAFACLVLFVLIPSGIDDPGSIDVLALGPAFRPSVISVFLGVMGLVVGVQVLRRSRAVQGASRLARDGAGGPGDRDVSDAEASGFSPMRWLGALALLAAYYAGLDRLGMLRANIPAAPFLIAFVLGPLLEDNFRQSLLLSQGSLDIFVRNEIYLIFWCLTVVAVVLIIRRQRSVPGTE